MIGGVRKRDTGGWRGDRELEEELREFYLFVLEDGRLISLKYMPSPSTSVGRLSRNALMMFAIGFFLMISFCLGVK